MNLQKLYNLAKKGKINIYDCSYLNENGIFLNYENCYIIGLNYKKITTITKEKCVLAEELGHYYYDAVYKVDSNFQLVSKQEYKSLKWRSLYCVTLNSILDCFLKRNMQYIRYC